MIVGTGKIWQVEACGFFLLIFTEMALLFQFHYQSYHMNITAHPREPVDRHENLELFAYMCGTHAKGKRLENFNQVGVGEGQLEHTAYSPLPFVNEHTSYGTCASSHTYWQQ